MPVRRDGEVVEWSITAVLKTVERQRSGGSNPSLSAKSGSETIQSHFSFLLPPPYRPNWMRQTPCRTTVPQGAPKAPVGPLSVHYFICSIDQECGYCLLMVDSSHITNRKYLRINGRFIWGVATACSQMTEDTLAFRNVSYGLPRSRFGQTEAAPSAKVILAVPDNGPSGRAKSARRAIVRSRKSSQKRAQ